MRYDRSVCWRYVTTPPYAGSPYTFGIDAASIIFNKHTRFDGTEPVIIALHPHNGTAYGFGVPFLPFGHQLCELARAGYIVVPIGAGGGWGWPSPVVDAVITAAIAWAQTPKTDDDFATGVGGKAGKVGLYGYSMGGGNAVSYAKNHQSKVAAVTVLAPAINLDVFMPEPEIDSLYAGAKYATKTSGGTVTINTTPSTVIGFDDTSHLDASGSLSRIGSSSVEKFSYTGKTATTLTGCTTSSGSITIGNNNIVAQWGGYTGHEGYNAIYDAQQGLYLPAAYNVPTRLRYGSADATVVPATVTAFLAAAANPIIESSLIDGATHTSIFDYLASNIDVNWLAQYLS